MKFVYLLLSSFAFGIAFGQGGFFTNPPPGTDGHDMDQNPQWLNGSTQILQWNWTSKYDDYTIFFFQINKQKGPNHFTTDMPYKFLQRKSGDAMQESSSWVVTPIIYDLDISEVFFFQMINASGPDDGHFESHYFNITLPGSSSLASQAPTSSATSVASPATSPAPPATSVMAPLPSSASLSATNDASKTSSPAPSDTSALPAIPPAANTNDKRTLPLALGIGIGLGVPLILLLGVAVGLRIVRARRANAPTPAPPVEQAPPLPPKADVPAPSYDYGAQQAAPGPVELESPQPQSAQLHRISELY